MNTEWYWSGTLKAFAKMLSLRLDPHTQKESTDVAKEIRKIIEPLFPVSVPALLGVK
jgi:thymidylate synthase (FAD)